MARLKAFNRLRPTGHQLLLGSLGLLLLALQAVDAYTLLHYDRSAIEQGEIWRWMTAHLVHLGWAHTLLNLGGLLICSLLAPARDQGATALLLLFLAFGISGGIYLFNPEITNFAGLSGALYGLYLWLLWPLRREKPLLLMLILLVGWATWQNLIGPLPHEAELIGGNILVQAHAYGLLLTALALVVRALLVHHSQRASASCN